MVVSAFDEVTRTEFDDTAGARRDNLNAKEGYLVPYLEAATIEELIMFLFIFGRCSLYCFDSMNSGRTSATFVRSRSVLRKPTPSSNAGPHTTTLLRSHNFSRSIVKASATTKRLRMVSPSIRAISSLCFQILSSCTCHP